MISRKYFLIGLYKNKEDALVYSLYHSTLLDWTKIMLLSTQPGLNVFHKKILLWCNLHLSSKTTWKEQSFASHNNYYIIYLSLLGQGGEIQIIDNISCFYSMVKLVPWQGGLSTKQFHALSF